MKKKLSTVFVLMLLIIGIATFTGCTKKVANKADFDKASKVENNGSHVVRKGKYIYFANGYQDKFEKNEWGKPVKGALYRAEVDEKGKIKKGSQKPFVQTIVWTAENSNEQMGLYIYDEWIYYVSPNIDRDSSGKASTTHLDFWRTSLDGTKTQKIYTVDKREIYYTFKKTHVIFFADKTLYTLDFSPLNKVKGNSAKINKKVAKNLKTIQENVTSYLWNINSDYIFFVSHDPKETKKGMDLMRINYKGLDRKAVIPRGSYLTEEEKKEEDKHQDKLFSFRLIEWVKNDTENSIMYKKIRDASSGEVSKIYANTVLEGGNLDYTKEKEYFKSDRADTYYKFLGIEKGVLEFDKSTLFHYPDGRKFQYYDKELRYVSVSQVDGSTEILFLSKELCDVLYKGGTNENPQRILLKGLAVKRYNARTSLFGNILYYFNEKDGALYQVDISDKESKPENVSIEEKKEEK